MASHFLVCADCDHKFTIPFSEDPYQQVCPECGSKSICERLGVVNTQCIDKMKECDACPFNENCSAS